MVRCAVCGTQHSTCGQRTTSVGADTLITEGTADVTLNRYEVDFDLGKGRTTKATLKLSDAEAKRMGLLEDEPKKKATTPRNKSRSAAKKA